MSTRPAHAKDCPGCDTGWTVAELLCPLCTTAVHTSQPELYDRWLHARGIVHSDTPPPPPPGRDGWVAIEAFHRGFIVGSARILSRQRAAQHAEWLERKQRRQQRRARP